MNNTNLEITADCYVPLDVAKYYNSLRKGTRIDTLLHLKRFIPLDIRNFYEKNVPIMASDFNEKGDSKTVNVDNMDVFKKYMHNTNYRFVEARIYFNIQRKKIDDILALNIRDFMPMAMSFGAGKYCTIEQKRILIS